MNWRNNSLEERHCWTFVIAEIFERMGVVGLQLPGQLVTLWF
jgi:hypothetical protein